MPRKQLRAILLFCWGASIIGARSAQAQRPSRLDLGAALEVGGEGEQYVRALQVAGVVPLSAWTIQPFSASQNAALTPTRAHPWSARFDSSAGPAPAFRFLRPSARLVENTAFPFQVGNGPTWDGRGLTAEAQFGVAANWRFVHAQLAPVAFVAQNEGFALAPNGAAGAQSYGDARFPENIDAPQRFGSAAYHRISPGTSFLSVDAFGVTTGLSSAPQRWGPAREYPLVLGPNAGGFTNFFFGTARPVDLWFAKVQGRVEYGKLGQSAYSPVDTGTTARLGSGVVLSGALRWIPGLDVGISRFMHRPWTGFPSASELRRPFSGVVSTNINGVNQAAENQVASVFARWLVPAARAEFYGEFYKEDFPGQFHVNANSLIEKPDDLAAFMLGFQRVFTSKADVLRVFRGELVNGETSHQERGERGFTSPQPPYIHSEVLQGHTFDGMILGSPEAYGGSGWSFGLDEYTPAGRRSVSLERTLRFDWLPTRPSTTNVHPDVIYGVRLEMLRFHGRQDYGFTLIPAIDLNRNLVAHHDVPNLTAVVSARGWP